jgi:hypothetical protein
VFTKLTSKGKQSCRLLTACANENWDEGDAPWPAPAVRFLKEASQAEAAQLAQEISVTQAFAVDG